MANVHGLEEACIYKYETGFPTLGNGSHTWYRADRSTFLSDFKSGRTFDSRLGGGIKTVETVRHPSGLGSFPHEKGDYALHATVEEGETVLLSAEAIFEAEMLTLTGRKDGGRPFMLRTQLHILGIIHPETRPHTPGTHRLGSWHSELFSAELLAPPLTLLSRVRTKGDPSYFRFN